MNKTAATQKESTLDDAREVIKELLTALFTCVYALRAEHPNDPKHDRTIVVAQKATSKIPGDLLPSARAADPNEEHEFHAIFCRCGDCPPLPPNHDIQPSWEM